jgi:hypothetical protein
MDIAEFRTTATAVAQQWSYQEPGMKEERRAKRMNIDTQKPTEAGAKVLPYLNSSQKRSDN